MKILIAGHVDSDINAKVIAELYKAGIGAEIATTENMKQIEKPKEIVMPIMPPMDFEVPFSPPITRAQRRKNQRKNNH